MAQEIEHMDEVDSDPKAHMATAEDEEEVLRQLYGQPDENGIFLGEEVN